MLPELVIVGAPQRSGHHAVIDWYSRSYEKAGHKVAVYNWVNHTKATVNFVRDRQWFHTVPHETPVEECSVVLYNLEDPPQFLLKAALDQGNKQLGEKFSKVTPLIILRDFYNMAASRLKRETSTNYTPFHVDLVIFGDFFNELTTYGYDSDYSIVKYNEWVRSRTYRDNLADACAIQSAEEAFKQTSDAGGGSSFTGLDKSPSEMPLLRRWEAFRTNPRYLNVIKNKDAQKRNMELFGWALEVDKDNNVHVIGDKARLNREN